MFTNIISKKSMRFTGWLCCIAGFGNCIYGYAHGMDGLVDWLIVGFQGEMFLFLGREEDTHEK